jgi:transcriptional regulator with XRE-family HTH domain
MAKPRSDNIKAIRQHRGLKRSELAMRVGKSYKHIWGIERGIHPAAEETLQRIADALLVDLGDVMVRDERGVA